MGVITINNRKLFTLNPDGTELKELIYPGDWTQNRIGEYKKIELECSSTQDLADSIIYFNPALYIGGGVNMFTSGAIPNEGYSYVVDSAATMGSYPMTLEVNTPFNSDLIKNWEATIEIGYGNDFKIIFKYYQNEDRSGFLSSISQYNHDKLLKDKIASVPELTVAGNSVYTNQEYIPRFYICQVDIANPSLISFVQNNFAFYKAGFYNKNEHETAPSFYDPIWSLSDTDGSRTDFGILIDTKVDFSIQVPAPPAGDLVWLSWLIRTDTLDNSVSFEDNYEASFAKIIDEVGTTTLDNKLRGPAIKLADNGGGLWAGYFHVNKSELNLGATYRLISVIYDLEGGYVNSFISDEIVTAVPSFDGVGYTFNARLRDYFNDWYGNDLICVVEERLASIIDINYDYFGFSDDILTRLGLVVPNDIRRYLTEIKVEIFEQPSVQLRNYFERAIAYKTSPTTYSTPSGMTLDFTTGNLQIRYDWRNRYESWVPNIESTFNGVIIPPTTDQNWATKTLYVKTSLKLFYDDYSAPFTDEVVFTQTIRPKDYISGTFDILVSGSQAKPALTDYYCSDEEVCLDARLTTGSYALFRLLTTIEQEPGNIASIEEEESLSGVLPQLDTLKFINQESAFGETVANRAKFCIEPTELVYNKFYKVCAIAKKLIP